jgi:hypothetical protein
LLYIEPPTIEIDERVEIYPLTPMETEKVLKGNE